MVILSLSLSGDVMRENTGTKDVPIRKASRIRLPSFDFGRSSRGEYLPAGTAGEMKLRLAIGPKVRAKCEEQGRTAHL